MVDGEARHDAAFLSAVLRDAPVPLWIISPDGLVSLANEAAVRFLGHRSGGDVLGGPSHDLLHRHRPDGSPYPSHECPIICSTRSRASAEWFVTRAGDVRAVQWSTQPVGTTGDVLLSFTALGPHGAGAVPRRSGPRTTVLSTAEARARLRAEMWRSIDARFVDATFSTADLAEAAHLSVRSVQAIFAEVGASPAAEIRRRRLDHARVLLEDGHGVQSACHASGFLDVGTFARAYRQQFGFAPSRTRPPVTP